MIKPNKALIKLIVLGALCFTLIACVPTINPNKNVDNPNGKLADFFNGLWDGSIIPVSFVVSLFNHKVNVYETYNNGNWYNFGFLLGVGGGLGIKFNVWGDSKIVTLNIFSPKPKDKNVVNNC